MKKVLVTGVMGFIGSYFAKYILEHRQDVQVAGFGRNSSQKNLSRIKDILDHKQFSLKFGDLTDADAISELLEDTDTVVHFAAKTFVDHAIKDPRAFINSNIIGTYNLLEQTRKYKISRFIQVSTDEVYGSILKGGYKEDSRLNPTNPYSAAKASADMLCLSYFNTYNTPIIITRTENNYGPFQHPQKALPVFVRKALADEKLPIYGDGKHCRMWLHVEDHCRAIEFLIDKGKNGEIYHVAGEQELQNIELGRRILKILNKPADRIELIDDHDVRPGHDRRYALDVSKLKALGWKPQFNLKTGLAETVSWYKDNPWWLMQ